MSIGGLIAVLGGLLLLVLGKVCLDLASKQVQGWLFELCFLVLRVARHRLPTALRVARHDEELVPELEWILFDKYANEPIVGLYKGFSFAIGHIRGAKRLARESVDQLPAPKDKRGFWVTLPNGQHVYIERRRRWFGGWRRARATGWFYRLSGSHQPEGAGHAPAADASTEYVKTQLPGMWVKVNDQRMDPRVSAI